MSLPTLYVKGSSNTGKTTLISRILSDLSKEYKIATIKTTRGGFDVRGKDTDRLFESGAYIVVGISKDDILIRSREKISRDVIDKLLENMDVDLVIFEGMKEVKGYNIALSQEFSDERTIAVYDGRNYEEVLEAVRKFIEIGRIFKRLPGLDCGKCGYDCFGLAKRIYLGENVECVVLSKKRDLEILVNNKQIHLNPFVEKVFKNVILSFLRELKGYEPGSIVIRLEDRGKIIHKKG